MVPPSFGYTVQQSKEDYVVVERLGPWISCKSALRASHMSALLSLKQNWVH